MEAPVNEIKKASLIQGEGGQTIKVPEGFELPGTDITITKDGDRLIIEPAKAKPTTWAELLDQMETIDVEWPDIDEGLLPLDDIKI